MKKAFFEDSAMAMAKLIVESIYHGMEENEGVYADLMYSNGKGQHGWAHIFQNEHEHLTKAGYRVVLMSLEAGSMLWHMILTAKQPL